MIYGNADVQYSTLHDGAMINGNAKVTGCTLKDVSEVNGDAVLSECTLTGRSIVSEGNHSKEKIDKSAELRIRSGKGNLL